VIESPTTNEKFRFLFDEHFEAIARYCLRRLPTAEVNDATAEVFLVTWKKINQVPEGEQAVPWLYGVARNVVRNSLRSRRRSYRLVDRLRGLAPISEFGPEPQVIRRDEDQGIVEALSRLDSDDQEVLRLRAYEGMTSPQIAVALGCSEEAAKKRVARALQRLRRVAGPTLTPDRREMHPHLLAGRSEG
jgi:RNA polymerase sigma-70 factor (ECF subfamily)